MFAGQLTKSTKDRITTFEGTISSQDFDVKITLSPAAKMSQRSPDYRATAVNARGRVVPVGAAWVEKSEKTGNKYLSLQLNFGEIAFRVNAVQTNEAVANKSKDFEIIPFISNERIPSASMTGELERMDADNAFAGHIASMTYDQNFTMLPNELKTAENQYPDYHMVTTSPKGVEIRLGAAWLAKSKEKGHEYIQLVMNTQDGELRVNAVQNEEQRGTNAFSIIPFLEVGTQERGAAGNLQLVG